MVLRNELLSRPPKMSSPNSEALPSISRHKHEYLEMLVPALAKGETNEVKLGEFLGPGEDKADSLAIMFYPADFSPLAREEILEIMDMEEQLKEARCQVRSGF